MAKDPTEAIRARAAKFAGVETGTSCNQNSFKAGKGSFLFIGPGAKGQGYKAMFKLHRSIPQARKLAAQEPERFQVGSTGWVSARFSQEEPLPKSVWEEWLKESYELCCETGSANKKKSSKRKQTSNTKKKMTAKRNKASARKR